MGIVFVLSEQFATTGEGLLEAARLDGLKPRHYYYFFFFFLYFFTSKGKDEREGRGRQVGGELPNSRTRQKRRKTGGRTKVKRSARARARASRHTNAHPQRCSITAERTVVFFLRICCLDLV